MDQTAFNRAEVYKNKILETLQKPQRSHSPISPIDVTSSATVDQKYSEPPILDFNAYSNSKKEQKVITNRPPTLSKL